MQSVTVIEYFVVFTLSVSIITAELAKIKCRSVVIGFAIGLFLSLFGLLYYLFTPSDCDNF